MVYRIAYTTKNGVKGVSMPYTNKEVAQRGAEKLSRQSFIDFTEVLTIPESPADFANKMLSDIAVAASFDTPEQLLDKGGL